MFKVHLNKRLSRKGNAVYSVLTRSEGGWRVSQHTSNLTIQDAIFKVQKGGSYRAKKTGQRNVHAFICGTPTTLALSGSQKRVSYNPFKEDTFVIVGSGEAISEAPIVAFRPDGVWIEASASGSEK
jgi:hypothetical protein